MSSKDEFKQIIDGVVKDTLDSNLVLDWDKPFSELGFDSMLLVLIHENLEKKLEIKIPETIALDYPTMNKLSDKLFELKGGSTAPFFQKGGYSIKQTSESTTITREGVGEIIFESNLSGVGCLDKIVTIEKNGVQMYLNMSSPPSGQGLNRSATVTLFDFKTGKTTEQLEPILKRQMAHMSPSIVSYDGQKLVYTVQQFCK